MQFKLLALALGTASFVCATPTNSLEERAAGSVKAGACRYTVTKGSQVTAGNAIGTATIKTFRNCLKQCSIYNLDVGGCNAASYDLSTKACTLYNTATDSAPNTAYDSATLVSCNDP